MTAALPLAKRLRYAGEAFLLRAFFTLLRRLPRRYAIAFGRRLGLLAGRMLKKRQALAERNMARALPEISPEARRQSLRGMWANLGSTAAELAHLTKASPFTGPDACKLTIIGEEHLQTWRDGQPCLLVSGHLGAWELLPAAAKHLHRPMHIVFREANNPVSNAILTKARAQHCLSQIPKGVRGARAIVRALSKGEPVSMLIDQKMNDGIAVPFFGITAMTVSAPAELAHRFGLHLLPVRAERLSPDHYRITLGAPVVPNPDAERDRDVLRLMMALNHTLENWIRQNPGDWYWLHQRWPAEG